MKLKNLEQLEIGFNEIQRKLDQGLRMRFYVSYAHFKSDSDFKDNEVFLKQFLGKDNRCPENPNYNMGFDKLKEIMSTAVSYYSNVVASYNRQWNELRFDKLHTFKDDKAFTGGFMIMGMSSNCGSGSFSLYISFVDESELLDEANKYKSPYRELLLDYIESDFRPSANNFKSELFPESNSEDTGIYDLLLKSWYGCDVEENMPYSNLLDNSLNECVEEAQRLIFSQYPQYSKDISVERYGEKSIKVMNTYLDKECGLKTCSRTEYWSDSF